MVEMNLYARDFVSALPYCTPMNDSLVHSWLNHILCSHHSSMPISNVYSVHSGSISSHHFPVFFQLIKGFLFVTSLP